jgi:hypothetical protein
VEKEQLRDHFAGLAMQSLLSRSDVSEKILSLKPGQIYNTEIANISKFSYIIADQMLNAKNKRQLGPFESPCIYYIPQPILSIYPPLETWDKIIKNKVIQETKPG